MGVRLSLMKDFSSKFKNISNRFYTKAIFYEMNITDKDTILYTLKDEDHLGYPSLYRLYMEMDDITEYQFATTYFHSWAHWDELSQSGWFQPYISKWREELLLRRKMRHIREIERIASEGGKDSLAAQKYLLERAWEKNATPRKRVGRPDKPEDTQTDEEVRLSRKMFSQDYDRIIGVTNN
jgi:hypothetical protein